MKLPELALCARTARGLGRSSSQRVHGEGKVFVSQRHLIAKLFPQLREIRVYFLAVRTLIVREFDDLDRSVLRTEPRSLPNLDFGTGLVQLNYHAVFPSKFGEVRIPRFFHPQLVYGIDDVAARRLIRLVGL